MVAQALITSTHRLKPYFQSHQVAVKMNYPIKQVMRKLELAERMVAWSVELLEFDIQYEPYGPMKHSSWQTSWQISLGTTKPP